MSSSSIAAAREATSREEEEQRLYDVCANGYQSFDRLKGVVESCLLPYSEKNKCYSLLQYLILHGWDMKRARIWKSGSPTWLGEKVVLQDIELARWLLDHGMDPAAGSIPSSTPHSIGENGGSKGYLLYFTSCLSSLETFKLFQSRGANLEYSHALHGAAGPGGLSQIPIIRHLLDGEYLDVNELDIYHIPHTGTPLMAAITGGYAEVVRVLLEYGANPYASRKSPFEATAMSMAQGLAHRDAETSKEIVAMLTEAMANWDGDPRDAPVSFLAPFPDRKTVGI